MTKYFIKAGGTWGDTLGGVKGWDNCVGFDLWLMFNLKSLEREKKMKI